MLVITPFTIFSTALVAFGVWKVTDGNLNLCVAAAVIFFSISCRVDTAVGKIERALEAFKK